MSNEFTRLHNLPVAIEPDWTPNALAVLEDRYLMRDDHGHVVETPADLFRRVARAVAAAETTWGASAEDCLRIEEEFYRFMAGKEFLPNSPTLMNAGRPLGLLSACFVLPLGDSIQEIMETARQIAMVQRAGGGTGIDLSALRPKGSIVRSSGGTTEGPFSFLRMFSAVTDAIQQGAFRRGANMGVMRIDHPDILAFIDIKSDQKQLANYNLSVAMNEKFMESLKANPDKLHVVANPHTGQQGLLSKKSSSAIYDQDTDTDDGGYYTTGEIWDRIVKRAWQFGEPGLVFIDEVNHHNPTPHLGTIRATNPCGEQPLLPYEACNLGSINLATLCKPSQDGSPDNRINWDRLKQIVELAVRFLDDVVDVNQYPTPEIREASRASRKIGLGIMGFADLLFELAVPYDSEEALGLADRIGSFVQEAAWGASERLAQARGPFPAWSGSVWDTTRGGRLMRNAQVTTIAPTGTISLLAGCSSGIEPLYSLAFTRQVLGNKKLLEINPIFERVLREQITDEDHRKRIIQHAAAHGSVQDLNEVPPEMKAVFRTARDVRPEWHVRMQAAWQSHTDAAVSKTVNLAADAAIQDVEEAYLLAYELKCKGITVYRDGSRPLQPMALTGAAPTSDCMGAEPVVSRPIRLPEVMPSIRLRQATPFGNMHLHISVEPQTGKEREVFAQLGKGGDLANSDLEAICRLVSLLLRTGGELHTVIDQLDGIGSSLSVPSRDGRIKSLGDGLARALRKFVTAKERDGLDAILSGRLKSLDSPGPPIDQTGKSDQEILFKIKCPDCDSAGSLAFEEGCLKCHACGYSMC